MRVAGLVLAVVAACDGGRSRAPAPPPPPITAASVAVDAAIDAARPRPTELAHLTLKALGMT